MVGLENYGPISLAVGSLAATVTNALVAIYFRPKSFPWLPGVAEIKRVLRFGSQLTASSILGVIADSAPELFLGKLQNLNAAGLYSRSNGLVHMFHRLFVDAVGAVCLPWFAKQARDRGSIADPFLKATSYVTALGWSFCLAVVCLAHPIVRALYGTQWDQAVDLARLLAVAMIFGVPASLCSYALLSSGAVTEIARVTAFSTLQSVVFVALGASHGLVALGCAMIVSAAVSAALWLRATSRHIGVPLLGLLGTLRQSAIVAFSTAIFPLVALTVYGPYPEALLLPLSIGGLGVSPDSSLQ
ncbi:MAG: oligosaccharide flippase family protein [Rhodoferax sp.]|nr:oligosaccharide flippase family protein [Rhodoferax sp.]